MSEREAHTAGPWCIPSGDGNELVVCEGENDKHPGKILFVLHPPRGTRHVLSYAELAANARLIAAAPDLLAKAYAADTCLSVARGYAIKLGKHDEANHIIEVQQGVRAAIAAATGEKHEQ